MTTLNMILLTEVLFFQLVNWLVIAVLVLTGECSQTQQTHSAQLQF